MSGVHAEVGVIVSLGLVGVAKAVNFLRFSSELATKDS
jgi:hypothetical protein